MTDTLLRAQQRANDMELSRDGWKRTAARHARKLAKLREKLSTRVIDAELEVGRVRTELRQSTQGNVIQGFTAEISRLKRAIEKHCTRPVEQELVWLDLGLGEWIHDPTERTMRLLLELKAARTMLRSTDG